MNRSKRRSITAASKRRSLNRSNGRKSSNLRLNSSSSNGNQSIKVIVRVRPRSPKESESLPNVVSVVDNCLLVFDPPPPDPDEFFFQGQKQLHRDLNKRVHKNINFMFDHIFDGSCMNEQIFADSIQSSIDTLLAGFNCSVFAYGATGAGKTFTMLGGQDCPGLIYLIVKDLFERINNMTDKICELNVSYLEVYNETVKDLLRQSSPLLLRDDARGVSVAGLSFQKPTSAEGLLDVLHFGNQNRTQHPTDANAESSRSHAVFQIYLRVKDRVGGLKEKVQLSKMSLIDLAGSERASVVSNNAKNRLREGANINQSLLALGTCINALADKSGKTSHVPYRNSKLTRILKDSLGGNCKTIMIAAISPSSLSYEETYNTLKYAERAKRIKSCLKRNTANIDVHLQEYQKIVKDLQTENQTLKRKLADQENLNAKRAKPITADKAVEAALLAQADSEQQNVSHITCHSLDPHWQAALDELCEEQAKIRRDLQASESRLQASKALLLWRQFAQMRVTALTSDGNKIHRSVNKMENWMKVFEATEQRAAAERARLLDQLQRNLTTFNSLTTQCSEIGRTYMEMQMHKLLSTSLQAQVRHTVDVAVSNLNHTRNAWKLCQESLSLARMQQSILKGHGFLTPDLTGKFDTLLKESECAREVAWADDPPNDSSFHQEFVNLLTLPSVQNMAVSIPVAREDPFRVPQQPLATYYRLSVENSAEMQQPLTLPQTPTSTKRELMSDFFMSSPRLFCRVASPVQNGGNLSCGRTPPPIKHLRDLPSKDLLKLLDDQKAQERNALSQTFVSNEVGAPQDSNYRFMAIGDSLSPASFGMDLATHHKSTPSVIRRTPYFSLSQKNLPVLSQMQQSSDLELRDPVMPLLPSLQEPVSPVMVSPPLLHANPLSPTLLFQESTESVAHGTSYTISTPSAPEPHMVDSRSPHFVVPACPPSNSRLRKTYVKRNFGQVGSVTPVPRIKPMSLVKGTAKVRPPVPVNQLQTFRTSSTGFKSSAFYGQRPSVPKENQPPEDVLARTGTLKKQISGMLTQIQRPGMPRTKSSHLKPHNK